MWSARRPIRSGRQRNEIRINAFEEVAAQVNTRAAAMVAADVDAIAAMLDDRLVYTHSSGIADTRGSYVEKLNRWEYTTPTA